MVRRGLRSDSAMQGSSSGSPAPIDPLTQLGGQDVQDHPDRNQDNAETDTPETLQNKGNHSAGQKEALSQFFLESVLPLFRSAAGPEHEEGIRQLEQTAQGGTLGGAATAPPQDVRNVPPLRTTGTLSAAERNAILMQVEDEFGTEEPKGFKPEKAPIYTGKSTHELESWIHTCENAFSLGGFQKDLTRVRWANQFLDSKKHQIMERAQIQHQNDSKKLSWPWFCLTLRDDIDHPENRAINTMSKYEKAHQREGQDIVSFAAYLDPMDDELGYNDEQRQRHLLMKMRPALQRKIREMPVPPVDRRALIDYAQRLEGLEGYGSKAEPARSRKEESHSTRTSHNKRRTVTPPTSNVDKKPRGPPAAPKKGDRGKSKGSRSSVLCYNCGEEGHIRPNCPHPPKDDAHQVQAVKAPDASPAPEHPKNLKGPRRSGASKGRHPSHKE